VPLLYLSTSTSGEVYLTEGGGSCEILRSMSQDNLEYTASSQIPTERKYITYYTLGRNILVEIPSIRQASEVRISDCRLSACGVVQSSKP
jgi:hypothetical protein